MEFSRTHGNVEGGLQITDKKTFQDLQITLEFRRSEYGKIRNPRLPSTALEVDGNRTVFGRFRFTTGQNRNSNVLLHSNTKGANSFTKVVEKIVKF